MTFDWVKIQQSKQDFRRRLAARPITEKLAMLDALRERTLALQQARRASGGGVPREEPPRFRTQPDQPE